MTKEKPPPPQTAAQMLLARKIDKDPSARLFCQTGRVFAPTHASVPDAAKHSSAQAESFRYEANVLNQAGDGQINENWVLLLDSQSACDVFYNPKFLSNIHDTKDGREIHMHCNARISVVKMIRDLAGYGTVWFYPGGIANILSLALVQKQIRVTFDSTTGNAFIVHDRSMRKFPMSTCALYYCDMGKQQGSVLAQEGNSKRGGDGIATVNNNQARTPPVTSRKQVRHESFKKPPAPAFGPSLTSSTASYCPTARSPGRMSRWPKTSTEPVWHT
jgi:hypothetical protein